MFATSVDGGEYVAVNGATYQDGLVMFTGVVFGVGVGGMIAAFVVMPGMYRAGLFTNAEYLEHRFGISARIISVLVQIQYRTATLATIAVALHLMLTEVAALPSYSAWILIVGLTAATTLYAAWGGLKTIAAADVLLGALMLFSTLVLWSVIWQEAGGWTGTRTALVGQLGEREAQKLLHIGSGGDAGSHPIVVVIGWCLIATGYFVVNHTQTMKMFGARSLWDLKMSVVAGTALIILSGYFSSSLGLLGRALVPGLSNPDLIYPAAGRSVPCLRTEGHRRRRNDRVRRQYLRRHRSGPVRAFHPRHLRSSARTRQGRSPLCDRQPDCHRIHRSHYVSLRSLHPSRPEHRGVLCRHHQYLRNPSDDRVPGGLNDKGGQTGRPCRPDRRTRLPTGGRRAGSAPSAVVDGQFRGLPLDDRRDCRLHVDRIDDPGRRISAGGSDERPE